LRHDRTVGLHDSPETVFRTLCRTTLYQQKTSETEKDTIADEITKFGK
jgi:hypothetical protein